MRIEAVVFDFGRTLFDPVTQTTFPETKDTLEKLRERKLKLGLVTIAETDDIELRENELVGLGLRNFFHSVDIVARSIGQKDFTKVLGELGLASTPEKSAIVGDNLKREITAGNRIGALTIWTTQRLLGNYQPQNENQTPSYTISRLKELVPLIDHINNQ